MPGPPDNVCLHVTGKNNLTVTFGEPLYNNGAIVTKYKGKIFKNLNLERNLILLNI